MSAPRDGHYWAYLFLNSSAARLRAASSPALIFPSDRRPIDRSLILLHLEGQSYLEIADVLGISEKNVGVKLSRLRKTLTRKAKDNEL